jgi:beta-glucosidase
LQWYKKTEVNPKEINTLSFSIPYRELGLWDKNMNYVIEPGEFEIMIGASAEDIRLKDTIIIAKK